MKIPHLSLASFAAAAMLLVAPMLTTTADAHKRGPLCRYKAIDSYGHVRTKVTRCHHLPKRYQLRPRPGFYLYFGPGGYYFGNGSQSNGGQGQELACLVTFFDRSQVSAGADANVERAQVLPRFVAEQRDGPNDRNRVFSYGSNQKTRDTCRYLDDLNNVNSSSDNGGGQDLVCLVTFFDRNQVSAGADATVEEAQLLPRSVAERRDGPDDRNRIFEYGSVQKTRDTCQYLDRLNN